MFKLKITDKLKKKLDKLAKKDRTLALIFKKKIIEILNKNSVTINIYKNLKSPMNEYKRIHLTDNYILLFKVDIKENRVTFVDIGHWDYVYGKK